MPVLRPRARRTVGAAARRERRGMERIDQLDRAHAQADMGAASHDAFMSPDGIHAQSPSKKFKYGGQMMAEGVVFETDWKGPGTDGLSVGSYVFGSDEISKHDCFHPNIAGQNAIATIVAEKAHWSR